MSLIHQINLLLMIVCYYANLVNSFKKSHSQLQNSLKDFDKANEKTQKCMIFSIK